MEPLDPKKKFTSKEDESKETEKNIVDETAPFKGMKNIISTMEKMTHKKLAEEINSKSNNLNLNKTDDSDVTFQEQKRSGVEEFDDVNIETLKKEIEETPRVEMKKNNGMLYSFFFEIVTLIVTFFRVGLIRIAPGTCGSLATIPFWIAFNYLIIKLGYNNFLTSWASLLVVLYILGSLGTSVYMKKNNKHDPGEIVIDEVVGQLIAFMIATLMGCFLFLSEKSSLLSGNNQCTVEAGIFVFLILILPFILFRFFDILKPNIVGWADRKLKGSLGVMLDDVFAGIFAGIATIPFLWIYQVVIC